MIFINFPEINDYLDYNSKFPKIFRFFGGQIWASILGLEKNGKVFITFPKLYFHVGGVSRILYFFNIPEFNDSVNFDSKFPIK